eukprot:905444-Alexandrium_andersonii.AAC.1
MTGRTIDIAWSLFNDPNGSSPPMGSDEFGPLPDDLNQRAIGDFREDFPPRPPYAPIADIIGTG